MARIRSPKNPFYDESLNPGGGFVPPAMTNSAPGAGSETYAPPPGWAAPPQNPPVPPAQTNTDNGQATTNAPPGRTPSNDRNNPGAYFGGDFDINKWGKNDPKYKFIQYASQYNFRDPSEREALLEALKNDPSGFFKNSTWKGDKLTGVFDPQSGGYGDVDVIRGMKGPNGGENWQWGAIPGSGTTPGPTGMTGSFPLGSGGGWNRGHGGGGTDMAWTNSFSGGGPGGGGGGGLRGSLDQVLQQLMNNGGNFNEGLVKRRVSGAQDTMNRYRSSALASDKEALAERGQLGSGGETQALARLDENLGGQFASQVNDIYSNEMSNADQRLMQSLSTAAGLSMADAQNVIEQFRANTDRELGFGNLDLNRTLGLGRLDLDRTLGLGQLDLGRSGQQLDWNKWAGQFGLDRERFAADERSRDYDRMLQIIRDMFGGARQSGEGFV